MVKFDYLRKIIQWSIRRGLEELHNKIVAIFAAPRARETVSCWGEIIEALGWTWSLVVAWPCENPLHLKIAVCRGSPRGGFPQLLIHTSSCRLPAQLHLWISPRGLSQSSSFTAYALNLHHHTHLLSDELVHCHYWCDKKAIFLPEYTISSHLERVI
jgi:hypothetical protein